MDPASSPEYPAYPAPPKPLTADDYWQYQPGPFASRPPSPLRRIGTAALATVLLSATVATLAFSYSGSSSSSSGDANGRQGFGQVSVFDLKAGDCFRDTDQDNPFSIPDVPAPPLSTATTVQKVSCAAPHNGEAYGSYTASGTTYPGQTTLVKTSDTECSPLLDAFVLDQMSLPTEAVDRRYFPTDRSWSGGDRRVTCYLRFPSGEQQRSIREDATVLVPEQVRYLKAVKDYNDLVAQLDPDTLDPTDPDGDPVAWTDMRQIAQRMPGVAQAEADALRQGPWSTDVQSAIDSLLSVKDAAVPVWRQAAAATDEKQFVGLLNRAESTADHTAAMGVRVRLGLSTKDGQAPIAPGQRVYV